MRGMLYAAGGLDVVAFAVAVATLLAVTLAAGLIPARRVAAVDPIATLRAN